MCTAQGVLTTVFTHVNITTSKIFFKSPHNSPLTPLQPILPTSKRGQKLLRFL